MKNLRETIVLRLAQLLFIWVNLALVFEVFMIVTTFTNPELNTKVGNEIMWKIDGTFKSSPDNIWYTKPDSTLFKK